MFNADAVIAAEIASVPAEYPTPLNFRERILAVESPVARELLLAGFDDFARAIEFPNEWLPPHLRKTSKKRDNPTQTVSEIEKRIEKLSRKEEANRRKKSAHAEEIERRVALYASQIQAGQQPNSFGSFINSPNEIQFEDFVYDAPDSRKPRSLNVQ